METLKEAFCRRFSCPPDDFVRRALIASLYPQARLLTLFHGDRSERFGLDRSVVAYCGRLRAVGDVEQEVQEYANMPENRRFGRRVLRLRLSGRRLRQLAQTCLTGD